MVLFNYVLVITYYPCMVMIYEYYAKYWYSPLSFCIKTPQPIVEDVMPQTGGKSSEGTVPGFFDSRLLPHASSILSLETADIDIEKYRAVEKFFYKTYAPFTFKYRRYIVAGFVLFFAVALGFATQLEASETPAQFLPDSDPLQVT